jgi:hypothetical protein
VFPVVGRNVRLRGTCCVVLYWGQSATGGLLRKSRWLDRCFYSLIIKANTEALLVLACTLSCIFVLRTTILNSY